MILLNGWEPSAGFSGGDKVSGCIRERGHGVSLPSSRVAEKVRYNIGWRAMVDGDGSTWVYWS